MSLEEGVIASYQFDITVDHNQICLEDCEREVSLDDLTTLYDAGAFARHLGVAPGELSIYTARWYGVVCLELIVRSDQPGDDLTGWDNVAEASLELPSGCLAAFGPESYPDGPRISVPPGMYRVRGYAGGIETVDEYMQEGQDHYRAVLWPAPYGMAALLHAGVAGPW
jgi:hypothetical protein